MEFIHRPVPFLSAVLLQVARDNEIDEKRQLAGRELIDCAKHFPQNLKFSTFPKE
jgi:hypothetical protein